MITRRSFFSLLFGQVKRAYPFAGDEGSVDKGYLRTDGSNRLGPAPNQTECYVRSENDSIEIDAVGGTVKANAFIFTPYTGSSETEFFETTPDRSLRYWEDQTGLLSQIGFKKGDSCRKVKVYTPEDAASLAATEGQRIDQRFPVGFKDGAGNKWYIDLMDPLLLS